MTIQGIQFVTDAQGTKVAVQLDLKEWGELWEDIYDNIVADSRKGALAVVFHVTQQQPRVHER